MKRAALAALALAVTAGAVAAQGMTLTIEINRSNSNPHRPTAKINNPSPSSTAGSVEEMVVRVSDSLPVFPFTPSVMPDLTISSSCGVS